MIYVNQFYSLYRYSLSLSSSLPHYYYSRFHPSSNPRNQPYIVHSMIQISSINYADHLLSTFSLSVQLTHCNSELYSQSTFVNTQQSVTGLRYATLNNANGSHVEWFDILRALVMRGCRPPTTIFPCGWVSTYPWPELHGPTPR